MTVRLRVKSIRSPNVEVDVWSPKSREEVYFPLELEIGPVGEEAADLFEIMVATPEGLRQYAKTEIVSERGLLVLSNFSWQTVHKALQQMVATGTGETWNESVLRLQRYFMWEYEDYVQS